MTLNGMSNLLCCLFVSNARVAHILTPTTTTQLKNTDTMSSSSYLKSPIITILVGEGETQTTLSAHLALLQQSPWFTERCTGFSVTTPAEERTVSLVKDDLDAVGAFLEYLYTKEYTPRLVPGPSGRADDVSLEDSTDNYVDENGENLLKHANIYTLAESCSCRRSRASRTPRSTASTRAPRASFATPSLCTKTRRPTTGPSGSRLRASGRIGVGTTRAAADTTC